MNEIFSKSPELKISDNKKFCSFYLEYTKYDKTILNSLSEFTSQNIDNIKDYDLINYISNFLFFNINNLLKLYIKFWYKEFNLDKFFIFIKEEWRFNLFLESISSEVKNNVKNITNK